MSPLARNILAELREGKRKWDYTEKDLVLPLFFDEVVVPMRELRDSGYITFSEVEKAHRGKVYIGGILVDSFHDK